MTRGRILGAACATALIAAIAMPAGAVAKPKKVIAFDVTTSQGLTGSITYHRKHPSAGKRAILATIPVSATCVAQNPTAPPTTSTTTETLTFGIAGNIGKNASSVSISVRETDGINPLNYTNNSLQITMTPKKKRGEDPAWKNAKGSFTFELGTGAKATPSLAFTKVCKAGPISFGTD
jgi:hypothetical protein